MLNHCPRNLIFGGTATVEQYQGDPSVDVHGPGFSKILLGDDEVDNWEKYLDVMVNSVLINSGRSCISCSGIWASRHTREIAEAMSERLGPVAPKPPQDPEAALAAFTVAGQAEAIDAAIEQGLQDGACEDVTARHRDRERLLSRERCAYLRPTLVHCESPEATLANTEYMFPFVSVVQCPQDQMLKNIGTTLVGSGITNDPVFRQSLLDCTHIDRLNLGPVPTIQLNWMQPHEGNLVDFLYRARGLSGGQIEGAEMQAQRRGVAEISQRDWGPRMLRMKVARARGKLDDDLPILRFKTGATLPLTALILVLRSHRLAGRSKLTPFRLLPLHYVSALAFTAVSHI